jgi:hypothetical protein
MFDEVPIQLNLLYYPLKQYILGFILKTYNKIIYFGKKSFNGFDSLINHR